MDLSSNVNLHHLKRYIVQKDAYFLLVNNLSQVHKGEELQFLRNGALCFVTIRDELNMCEMWYSVKRYCIRKW